MNIQYFVVALSLAVPLTLARLAVADVAYPACTASQMQTSTSECLECRQDPQGVEQRCTLLLTPYCYTSVCSQLDSGGYFSIWCRTKGAEAPAVPSETRTLIGTSNPQPILGDAGTAPSTCLPYTAPATAPPASADDSSGGCSASAKTRAANASLWGLLALAGLTVVRRRARSRRSQ
jgi:MYXO-CTERM domain-containing protein